jgi:hypothetical protein
MGQSYGTCGHGTSRQDSAYQQPDLYKEWMFQGIVAVPNVSEVVWDDVNDPVPDEVRKLERVSRSRGAAQDVIL